jgi:hypothetical protein
MKITDPRFKWIPSAKTDITKTWKRNGWKPTTEAERAARQRKTEESVKVEENPVVIRFRREK